MSTYLIEGVIATLEIKSNLSTGDPSGLASSFESTAGVLALNKRAYPVRGDSEPIKKLQRISSVKTYVIGYAGWKTKEALLENFAEAAGQTGGLVPDVICQPGFCIVRDDWFFNPETSAGPNKFLLQKEYPYAVLLHHLLKAIMSNTNGSAVTTPGIDAVLEYNLGPYFNIGPEIQFEPFELQLANRTVQYLDDGYQAAQ